MKIIVLLKMVPDVVEELELAADGKALDTEFLRMIANEFDNHALEEALLLKEKYSGTVTVVALDAPEVDDALFTALAKGADQALKITDGDGTLGTRAGAYRLAQTLSSVPGLLPADLILTGAQAIDDLDGLTAPLVSHLLGLPQLAIVTKISVDTTAGVATVLREFPGGVRGEYEVKLPAVLGIQAAEKPPRYVPVAKVRAAMKSQAIQSVPAATAADGGVGLLPVEEMSKPEVTEHAQMLKGSPEEIANQLCEILAARGLL
ncbi:MAG: electron transfer flavoprotein subunit beta/FixA family protein [Acidobacteriia bacterium]|nr:electron transfer flavoprotein subunit beta/FixA family protein [Terriglobia bacterium]